MCSRYAGLAHGCSETVGCCHSAAAVTHEAFERGWPPLPGVALLELGVAALLYALLVWRLAVAVLAKPVTGRLADLLG